MLGHFTHSFSQQLLSTFLVTGALLGSGSTQVNEKSHNHGEIYRSVISPVCAHVNTFILPL